MRPALLLATVLLPAGLLAAGCTSPTPVAGGAPSSAVAPSATPTSSAPSSPPAPSPSIVPSSSGTATPRILGPNGFGALKLGMTEKAATATGLITSWRGTRGGEGCGLQAHLRGGSGHDAGRSGTVLLSGSLGVATIDAYGDLRTPEGIHLGSSKAAVLRAYPDWRNATEQDPHADGRGAAKVPGNSKAFYRIEIVRGKVFELTLQHKDQNCYE